MIRYILSITLFGCLSQNFAQDSIKSKRKFEFNEIGVAFGFNSKYTPTYSLETLRIIAPNASLLHQDFSRYNFETVPLRFSNHSSGSPVSITAGWLLSNPNKNAKIKTNLRAGVLANTFNSGYLYDQIQTSTQIEYIATNNTRLITDSVHNNGVYINYKAQFLQLDGALAFETLTESKFSMYSGIGLTFGISTSSNITINEFESISYKTTIIRNNSNPQIINSYDFENSKSTYTSLPVSRSYNSQIYIPIGMQYKLSKKHMLLSKIHIYCETRPNLYFIKTHNIKTSAHLSNTTLVGVKILW